MNILVVDDNRLNLKVADGYLKMYFPDYNVELCQQSRLVMDILKEKPVDIILLDIMMPEINGIDLLKAIRTQEEYKEIQIVIFTAMDDNENFKTCFELGANDYLRKPIDTIEFQARIKACANTRINSLTIRQMYEKEKSQNDELMSLNSKLKDTQFHLIQSEKLAAIGELAAGVAHEINNPIGYVGSNLETMTSYLFKMRSFIALVIEQLNSFEEIRPNSINEELIKTIQESYKKSKIKFISEDLEGIISDSQSGIQKVAEIVKSLRSFARSGMEDERVLCPIIEIIQQVLLIAKNEAKYTVSIKLIESEIPEVYCNKGQIGQVLLNILVNAIQAIKSQSRTELGNITIKTYKENEFACISIKDDGPGISQEYLSKIFDPFFTTKEVGQGTGLGLSISYDIITKKHNGILDVKTKLGEGTEFIIMLPKGSESEVDL